MNAAAPAAAAVSRRRLFEEAARMACGAGACGLGLGLLAVGGARPAQALRPPGALSEAQFREACVRCGLCVRACPYDILRLSGVAGPSPAGAPYFIARDRPCEMCSDIPCVKACPTGALDPGLVEIDKADMGVAALVGRETCLNLQGLRCDVCYRVCPKIDKAITLERSHNARTGVHAVFEPKVHAEACTGCGKCEKACVLPVAAIRVLPRDLALGQSAAHYRLGWEEKNAAGAPLVDGLISLPKRLPGAAP